MSLMSARQQVRQETRNTQGEYSAYDATPSQFSLESIGSDINEGVDSLADRHGVEIENDANPLRVYGRAQDIRAMAIDMEREHGVETDVHGISEGGPGVENESFPLDEHVDDDMELRANIYHEPAEQASESPLRSAVNNEIAEAAATGTTIEVDDLRAKLKEDREEGTAEFSEEDIRGELTAARNAGILRRTADGYTADNPRRPVQGEPITAGEALADLKRSIDPSNGQLTAGHRLMIGEWDDGNEEFSEPKYSEMNVDDVSDDFLHMVGGAHNGYHDARIPLAAVTDHEKMPRFTRSEDGTITVELDESYDHVGVVPGMRYSIAPANVTDDYTTPKPLTDGAGKESPFDVGPKQYNQNPEYIDGVVTITQDVYNPQHERLGSIYQDSDEWYVNFEDSEYLDDDFGSYVHFDTAEEAAESLYYSSGGTGNWSKPTAESVPLFDLDESS